MAKGRVPTRDELLAFIKESATPVGKREIARAYGLKGDQRIELKQLLRDLRDTGDIAVDRAKTFKDPKALTDITVLEIVRVDADGHLLAVPRRHDEETEGEPPRIEIDPHGSRGPTAPAVGDRVLASLKRRGKNSYQAKIIRHLGSRPKKILGLYEETAGRDGLGTVTPTDKKLRREFDVRPADKTARCPATSSGSRKPAGISPAAPRSSSASAPMSDPRTVSLISIAANDIPVEFPEAALKEAEHSKAAPLGDRLDLRKVPLITIDGEDARDFDDAVFAEPDKDHPGGLASLCRDRRCELVRATGQAARPRRLPPRHLGLVPRPRRADAARGAVEPLVLSGTARGSPGAGRRDVDRRRRRAQEAPLPPRHDALGRAPSPTTAYRRRWTAGPTKKPVRCSNR